jgi:hypothetical protein
MSEYDSAYNQIKSRWMEIREWKYKGLSDAEVARRLCIPYTTLGYWKKTNPEFRDLLTGAKKFMSNVLLESLIKSAIGYEYIEESIESLVDPRKEQAETIKKRKITRKWYPPNVNAAIFLLCNMDNTFRRTDLPEIPEKIEGVNIIDDIKEAEK